jgi:hypothetical protein
MNAGQFQVGRSGNPGGRPTSAKVFRDAIMAEIKRKAVGPDGIDVERVQLIARRLVDDAINGDNRAVELIMDRIDGKVPQGLEHTGELEVNPEPPSDRDVAKVLALMIAKIRHKHPDSELLLSLVGPKQLDTSAIPEAGVFNPR